MLKKICLTLFCALMLCGAAQAAAPFETYLAAVEHVHLDKEDGQQKVGKALLVYMQAAMQADPLTLGGLLDGDFLLNGKSVTKKSVAQKLQKVFTPKVVQAVLASDPKKDILVRGGADFGFAAGSIWVNFTEDKPQKPVIIAVNTD